MHTLQKILAFARVQYGTFKNQCPVTPNSSSDFHDTVRVSQYDDDLKPNKEARHSVLLDAIGRVDDACDWIRKNDHLRPLASCYTKDVERQLQ